MPSTTRNNKALIAAKCFSAMLLMLLLIAPTLHAGEKGPDAKEVLGRQLSVTLVYPLPDKDIKKGEPLFVTVKLKNEGAKPLLIETCHPAQINPWCWQIARDGKQYVRLNLYNTASANGQDEFELPANSERSYPESLWFKSGRPTRALVANEAGIWRVRVAVKVRSARKDQMATITSDPIAFNIENANASLMQFVKELSETIGDDLTIGKAGREKILREAIGSENDRVRQYAQWLYIRSYLSDAGWAEQAQQKPKVAAKIQQLARLAKGLELERYRNTTLLYDSLTMRANGTIKQFMEGEKIDAMNKAVQLIKEIPLGYNPPWVEAWREFVEDDYKAMTKDKGG